MNTAYLNAIANSNPVTHIGLVNEVGVEITGGAPAYARQTVTWTAAAAGSISPSVDRTFNIPVGVTVGGWRGYSALSAGTDYEGASLTNEAFATQGQYILLAASMAINHNAV
jgi:hypothetical protein